MKILICGGHLTPALALIEHLPQDVDVLYVGRKFALEGDKAPSLEYQIISGRNIPFAHLTTGRIQRSFTRHTFSSLLKLPGGLLNAYQLVRKYKPDVIVGFGGYVSVPLCVAGKLLGIPIIIHEQTLEAGLANKFLAKYARAICISWATSKKFFPQDKTFLTGNPAVTAIAEKIDATKPPKKTNSLPHIVIVGGSLGSHALNVLIEGCLPQLLEKYTIFHQTGAAKAFKDFERLEWKKGELPQKLQERYTITQFIDPKEIIAVLERADLVIGRSGINTVTTLLLLNKPALLIPLPVSQQHEQQKNALFLKDHGLAEVLSQTTTTSETLCSSIEHMIATITKFTNTKDNAELIIHTQAAQNMWNIITTYAHKRS